MINLKKDIPNNYLVVWPEVTASYAGRLATTYSLELTQDYDLSSSSLQMDLLNSPNSVNPRLIFSLTGSIVPDQSGLYTAQVREVYQVRLRWSELHEKWAETQYKWGQVGEYDDRVLETERATISGSDAPVYQVYTTSSTEYIYLSGSDYPATEYTSSNELGAYKTYYNY